MMQRSEVFISRSSGLRHRVAVRYMLCLKLQDGVTSLKTTTTRPAASTAGMLLASVLEVTSLNLGEGPRQNEV
jgi:hypothetical protein